MAAKREWHPPGWTPPMEPDKVHYGAGMPAAICGAKGQQETADTTKVTCTQCIAAVRKTRMTRI